MKKLNKRFMLVVGAVVMVGAVVFFQNMGGMFKASLLEESKVPAYDGMGYPLKMVPDWTSLTSAERGGRYEDLSETKLVSLPEYDPAVFDADLASLSYSRASDRERINMKITYPVPYMGSYDIAEQEEYSGSHPAVDIKTLTGTPVYSIANGQVVKVKESNYGFGNYVVIGHPNVPDPDGGSGKVNLYSSYNHLDSFIVKDGQVVRRGDLIGYVGDTGTATTPHLHFQIDKEEAPFIPYWPFTSAEASKAGYDFFSAVNAGLGAEKAKEYTVNPLDYIQKNFGVDGGEEGGEGEEVGGDETGSGDEGEVEGEGSGGGEEEGGAEDLVLSSFEFFYEAGRVRAGEPFSVALEAQDQNGLKLSDYEEEVVVKVKVGTGVMDEVEVRFEEGSAIFNVLAPEKEGKMSLVVEVAGVKGEQDFIVEYQDGQYSFDLRFLDPFVMKGQSVRLEVGVKAGGRLVEDYAGGEPLILKEGGEGVKLSKNSLDADDFEGGEATVYVEGVEEGEYTVSMLVGEREYESDTVSVIESIEKPVAFEVEHDGDFKPGIGESVKIVAVDKNGNPTPNYSYAGKVELRDSDKKGEFEPKYLTAGDFDYGVATVEYVRKEAGDTVLTAQQGVIRGDSKPFRMDARGVQSLFTDVDEAHENAKAIRYLKENGVVEGYPDGSFQPERVVSRVEALKMILLGFDIALSPQGEVDFPDTNKNEWYAEYVGRAVKMGVVEGYPDGSFKPAQTVNKAELLKILFEATGVVVPEVDKVREDPYPDVYVGQWFSGYADYAKRRNLVPTDGMGRMEPGVGMTRADVAEVIYRLMILEETGASEYKNSLEV